MYHLEIKKDRAIANSTVAQQLKQRYQIDEKSIIPHNDPICQAIINGIQEIFVLPITTYGLQSGGTSNLWLLCVLPWFDNPLILFEIGLIYGHCSLNEFWFSDNSRKRKIEYDDVLQFRISNDSPTLKSDCINASIQILQGRGIAQSELFSLN